MFTKTLSQNAAGALALLGKSGILKDAYPAGGTACALQLGHRISLDLDFFTDKEFSTEVVLGQLEKLPGFKLDETAKWTILGSFPKVKFSYFYYITRSLDYFMDAEPQIAPKMLTQISWQEIKDFFRKEVIKLAKNKLKA